MATKASNMLVHVGRGSMVSRRTMSTAQKSGSGRQGTRKPLRSVVFASQAILVGVGAGSMAYTVAKMDLDVVKTMVNVFMPKEILNDASSNPDSIAPSRPGGFRLDTATDIQFPVELKLTTPGPLLTLVGLGVRTVSFLRVKVYSAGFYIEQSKSESLRNVPGWNNYTASHLLTAPVGDTDSPQLSGEALMKNLLDDRVSCAIRIVRNTDFGHLRDGFTRAIAARQKLARSKNQLSEQDEERIAQSTQTLKALFPAQSVPKGKALTLLRTSNGVLTVEYEGKILGQVNDAWMSRELMLAYFADKDVISNKLKEDVAKGFEEFIKP